MPSLFGRAARCAAFGALTAVPPLFMGPAGIVVSTIGAAFVEGFAYRHESPIKGFLSGVVHGFFGGLVGCLAGPQGIGIMAGMGGIGGVVTSPQMDEIKIRLGLKRPPDPN